MIGANACTSCRRLDREAEPIGAEEGGDGILRGVCSSFPEGIPENIWAGDHAHQVPLEDEETYVSMPGWEDDFGSYVEVHEAMTGSPPEGMLEEDPNRG
jgi:hypothetical protein